MRFQLEPRVDHVLARAVDELIAAAPNGHYSQQPGWPRLEPGSAGARHLLFTGRRDSAGGELDVAGWVRLRRVPLFGTVADVIRGPAARSPAALVDGIDALGQLLGKSALALRVDPYVSDAAADEVARGLDLLGFTPMRDEWSHRRTLEVDIDRPPEALLASFAPATRRHVRKALALQLEIPRGSRRRRARALLPALWRDGRAQGNRAAVTGLLAQPREVLPRAAAPRLHPVGVASRRADERDHGGDHRPARRLCLWRLVERRAVAAQEPSRPFPGHAARARTWLPRVRSSAASARLAWADPTATRRAAPPSASTISSTASADASATFSRRTSG